MHALLLSLKLEQMLVDTYPPWQAPPPHTQPEPEVSQQAWLSVPQYIELEDFASHHPEFAYVWPQMVGEVPVHVHPA